MCDSGSWNMYFSFFLLTPLLTSATEGIKAMNRTVGEDVVLPCVTERIVEAFDWTLNQTHTWKRILVYISDRPDYQDERFEGRVQLLDPDMKKGNLSVIIKKIKVNDSGIYTCEGLVKTSRRKRDTSAQVFNKIHLTVVPSSKVENNVVTGLAVGTTTAIILVILAVIAFWKIELIKKWQKLCRWVRAEV